MDTNHVAREAEPADLPAFLSSPLVRGAALPSEGPRQGDRVVAGAGPNQTDRDRAGLAYHFLLTGLGKPEWLEKVQPGHPLYRLVGKAHRPIIGGPDCSRGIGEYGEDIEGVLLREREARSSALS